MYTDIIFSLSIHKPEGKNIRILSRKRTRLQIQGGLSLRCQFTENLSVLRFE